MAILYTIGIGVSVACLTYSLLPSFFGKTSGISSKRTAYGLVNAIEQTKLIKTLALNQFLQGYLSPLFIFCSKRFALRSYPQFIVVLAGLYTAIVLACIAFLGLFAGFAFGSFCFGSFVFWATRTIAQRQQQENIQALPQILRSLAQSLSAGKTLMQALFATGKYASNEVGDALLQAAMQMQIGYSAQESLSGISKSIAVPGISLLVSSLIVSQKTGCPLRDLLLKSAQLMEHELKFFQEMRIKTAQARLSLKIVCLLPVLVVVFLGLISPEFRSGLYSFSGAICILVALMLDGLSLGLVHLMMKRAVEL